MGLRKTETDLNGRPLSEGTGRGVWNERDRPKWPRLSEGKRGMGLRKTETDLNGRPLYGGIQKGGRGVLNDRDGPKWSAPVKGEEGTGVLNAI